VTSVALVSPAWGRLAVTRLALTQRQALCGELAASGIDARCLVVADDENLDLAQEFGFDTLEAPNRPVARKFNLGLEHACREGADWIVWIGSDDWVHPDVFAPLLPGGALHDVDPADVPPIVIGHRLTIVDLARGALMRCKSPSTYGAIPWLLHRRMLEPAGFAPLRPDLDRGLDGALIRGLRLHRAPLAWQTHDPHDMRCVDFKSDTNITPYRRLQKLATAPEEAPWSALEQHYPADLVDLARATHLDLKEQAPCPS
jgi:glycosyltransferase involved in cell wall biosynthesis